MTVATKQNMALPITVRGLTKRYGDMFALNNIDLDVHSGEFLTLLGPSGSGKTTLLMAIAGFTRPDSGSLQFGDAEIIRLPPHKRDVGMVFQSYALFPHMSVSENVSFPLRLRKVSKADIKRKVEAALETVQLGGYGDRDISALSGGQRQRVALARAIVFEPRILLMDEPLSALDKKLREHMQIELRRLHDQLGMTTVYVTHDQREALTMSDRIAVINEGRLMQLGTPTCLYEQPANKFVADFIGDSTFLHVELADGNATHQGKTLQLAKAPQSENHKLLMIRPEKLRLLDADTAENMNVFTGTVSNVVYQGDSYMVHIALADGTEVAVRGVNTRELISEIPSPGNAVNVGLHREDTVLLSES